MDELDEDGLDEELGLLCLAYRPSLHTSAAGNHAPELRWQPEFHGEHPAFTHFHPPHLPPAQDAYSLDDRSTISPLSFSQYINPRFDYWVSIIRTVISLFSIPSTGLLCMV